MQYYRLFSIHPGQNIGVLSRCAKYWFTGGVSVNGWNAMMYSRQCLSGRDRGRMYESEAMWGILDSARLFCVGLGTQTDCLLSLFQPEFKPQRFSYTLHIRIYYWGCYTWASIRLHKIIQLSGNDDWQCNYVASKTCWSLMWYQCKDYHL